MFLKSSSQVDNEVRHGLVLHYRHLYRKTAKVRFEEFDMEMLHGRENRRLSGWVESFKPDVIMGFPVSSYKVLTQIGYRIPEDFAFASTFVDHQSRAAFDIAGCDTETYELQRRACHRLHQSLLANQRGIPTQMEEHVITPRWVDGRTLPYLNRG